jgi:FdhD protein
MTRGAVNIPTRRSDYAAAGEVVSREVPVEAPVAIEINGIAYAVMMATPCDVEDFVTGFLLSEGLANADEIGPMALHPVEGGSGLVVRINLPPHRAASIMERARRRLGDSSCGICGIESVEAALRPLDPLPRQSIAAPEAIHTALAAINDAQTLGKATAATHAGAFCDNKGEILVLREDVGRHNALDKVIGALAAGPERDPASGFLLVTSRASFRDDREDRARTLPAACRDFRADRPCRATRRGSRAGAGRSRPARFYADG